MRRRAPVAACCAALLFAASALAQCSLTQSATGVTISNEYVSLSFAPATGGKCSSFLLKEAGWELVRWPNSPAFEDRLWNVGAGYDLPEAAYQLAVLKNTSEEAAIRLTAYPKTPGMTKLRVEKEIALRAGSRRIDLAFRFRNEDAQPLPAAFWSAHVVTNPKEAMRFMAPTAAGVETVWWEYKKNPLEDPRNKSIRLPDRLVYAPPRGWQAMAGAQSGVGLAWTVPEATQGFVYDYMSTQDTTLEAIFNEVILAPGKELLLPTSFVVLKAMPVVHGAGAAGAGALDAADKVEANAEVVVRARVLAAQAGTHTLQAVFRPAAFVKGEPLKAERRLALTPQEPGEALFTFTPPGIGSYVAQVTVTAENGDSFDMERPVAVGAASEEYVLRPRAEKSGRPNPKWLETARGAAGQDEATARRVEQYVRGLGLDKPISLDWVRASLPDAQPFAGEPPRVLFCEPLFQTHQAVRAIQQAQMRFDHAIVMVPRKWYFLSSISRGETLWEPCAPILAAKLRDGAWDVIVWSSEAAQWKQLPAETQDLLVKAVTERGAALLYAANAEDMKDVPAAFGVKPGAVADPTRALAQTLTQKQTRFHEMQGAPAGKGRLLLYTHLQKTAFLMDPDNQEGTAEALKLPVATRRRYSYSDFARAIYFAAGRSALPQPVIRLAGAEIAQSDLGKAPIALVSATGAAEVEVAVRDLRQNALHSMRHAAADRTPAVVRVAHLAAGDYVLDARTQDAQGRTFGWRSVPFRVASPASVAIEAQEVLNKGEELRASVRCAGREGVALPGADRVRLEAVDTEGRLVFRAEGAAAEGDGPAPFVVPTRDVWTKVVLLRATLLRGGLPLASAERPVAVKLHRYTPFRFAELWRNWEWSKDFFHTDTFCGKAETVAWANLDNILWGNAVPGFVLENQSVETLVRNPCLTEPKFLEETRKWVRERIVSRPQADFEELGVIWADEWNYPSVRDMETNFCHSPTCLARLRERLRAEYRTIEALNAEWNTAFTAWEQVAPPRLEEVKKAPDRWAAAWADHRRSQDLVVREYFDFVTAAAREAHPQARIGLSGTRNPNAFNGMDWGQIMQSNLFLSSYGGPQVAYSRSFKRPEGFLSSWIGYDHVGLGDTRAEAQIWSNLFDGRDAVISYTTGYAPLFFGDGEPRPSGVGSERAVRAIQGGIAHLVKAARADNSGVAVLYSMADVRAATLDTYRGWRMGMKQFGNNQQSLFALLGHLGLSFDCVSTEQVAAGGLGEGYRLLALGYATAISPEVAARIREFAASGGTVLADVAPGVRDGHCRPLARGSLDDLFGVDQGGGRPSFAMVELATAGDRVQVVAGIPELRVTTGQAAARWKTETGEAPAVIVNSVGKGAAILLNFMVHDYSVFALGGVGGEISVVAQAKQRKVESIQRIVAELLAARGIAPEVVLRVGGKPFLKSSIYRWRLGGADYVGILPAGLPAAETGAEIDFGREGWLYDAVARRPLGEGAARRATVTLRADRPLFLCALPAPVKGLRIEAPPRARAGEGVEAVVTRDCASADTAFAEVQTFRPDGKAVWLVRHVVRFEANRATTRIPFALNDPAGTWRIVAVDAATGARGEREVVVEGER
jgi:hypothetical protein